MITFDLLTKLKIVMIIGIILKEINDLIKQEEGELNYDKWHVAITWKDLKQFEYDTKIAMQNVTQIGEIDSDSIDELTDALKGLGVDSVIEPEGTKVYVYKTLI